jgi:hypothetical protein
MAKKNKIVNPYPPNNTWLKCVKSNYHDPRINRGNEYLFLGVITNPNPLDDILLMDDRGIFTSYYDAAYFEVVKR